MLLTADFDTVLYVLLDSEKGFNLYPVPEPANVYGLWQERVFFIEWDRCLYVTWVPSLILPLGRRFLKYKSNSSFDEVHLLLQSILLQSVLCTD